MAKNTIHATHLPQTTLYFHVSEPLNRQCSTPVTVRQTHHPNRERQRREDRAQGRLCSVLAGEPADPGLAQVAVLHSGRVLVRFRDGDAPAQHQLQDTSLRPGLWGRGMGWLPQFSFMHAILTWAVTVPPRFFVIFLAECSPSTLSEKRRVTL